MAVNHSFHSLVQELAGNKVLSQAIDGLRQKILLYRYRQIYQPNRLKESMQEHRDLQQAFREETAGRSRSVHAGTSDPAVLGAENRVGGGIGTILAGIRFLLVTPGETRPNVFLRRERRCRCHGLSGEAVGVCRCPTRYGETAE